VTGESSELSDMKRDAGPCGAVRPVKSSEVIERKADARRRWRERVCKSSEAKGLNEGDKSEIETRERGLGIKSALGVGKHGRE
jgi:hypothetical protein